MTQITPSERWGGLFEAVQSRGIFPDSKTFADAIPRGEPEDILARWRAMARDDDHALLAFVEENFRLPDAVSPIAPPGRALPEHIEAVWPALIRSDRREDSGGSLLPLPRPYVVPGGRFRELYYWDSYFTMLGLLRSGRTDLVEDMIANFGNLIDRHGFIPNGTRSYYLTRSHPPVFHLMTALSKDRSEAARRRRLDWMLTEHAFWMEGAYGLAAGKEHRRVVRLPDGAVLNRYWDDRAAPRDESWREDVDLAQGTPSRRPEELWRDVRAAAESGWDFSSRWLADGRTLGSIRTTRLLPIDLNALLYGLERSISEQNASLGLAETARTFADHASARKAAIRLHLWNDERRFYADYDVDEGRPSDRLTAATLFPLFTGAADALRVGSVAAATRSLLLPGGLVATDVRSGQQWDRPNAWAPLVWVAIEGLRRCGEAELSTEIARRWIATVRGVFGASGQLAEKYDVEARAIGSGGEYEPVLGFGWTNGVTSEILHEGLHLDGTITSRVGSADLN